MSARQVLQDGKEMQQRWGGREAPEEYVCGCQELEKQSTSFPGKVLEDRTAWPRELLMDLPIALVTLVMTEKKIDSNLLGSMLVWLACL